MKLDGSGSFDPDGAISSFRWSQVGGPSVKIEDPDQSLASVYVPVNIEAVPLEFRLRVVDDNGAADSDQTVVDVQAGRPNRNDVTLNPLPDSVLLDPDRFSVRGIGIGKYSTAAIEYHGYGDTDQDGNPEIFVSGWTYRGSDPAGDPPPAALYIFEADMDSTKRVDEAAYLGTSEIAGTAFMRVADFDLNGAPDLVVLGHNESPFVPTENVLYSNFSSGFVPKRFEPKMANHEGNIGDFNGDGYPDLIAQAYQSDVDLPDDPTPPDANVGVGSLFLLLNDKAGGFKHWAIRFNQPVENGASLSKLIHLGGGSAAVFGNLDEDPEAEIVVVDAPAYYYYDEPSPEKTQSWVIDNIHFETAHAWGDFVPLPVPYLETNPQFDGNPSYFDPRSHDTQVELLDIDNDGDKDILVFSMIWVPDDGYAAAGVVQILRNDGQLKFTDVTDTNLYNFNLAGIGSHEARLMDVNRDGFMDIVRVDDSYAEAIPYEWGKCGTPWMGELYRSINRTWSNEILINTGTGRFVSTFWEGFHQLTMRQADVLDTPECAYEPYSLIDQRYFPYLLRDGRLGFVTFNDTYPPGNLYFFDARSDGPIFTGPHGTDTASLGAPGYSEYYYLTENPDVVAAIAAGEYKTGLEHYLAVGRAEGRPSFARGARVHGSAGNDTIILRDGDETAIGYGGDDFIDGGDGFDTAVYRGKCGRYSISVTADGYQVKALDNDEGTDTLVNVERLQFADQSIDL